MDYFALFAVALSAFSLAFSIRNALRVTKERRRYGRCFKRYKELLLEFPDMGELAVWMWAESDVAAGKA